MSTAAAAAPEKRALPLDGATAPGEPAEAMPVDTANAPLTPALASTEVKERE